MVLAQYHDGRLHYAGRAGSGFSDRDLADLSARFKKLRRRDAPLDQKPPAGVARKVRSLDPELVTEIAFAEFTSDGIVRHGRFIGMREDKPAGTVEREKATPVRAVGDRQGEKAPGLGFRLTHSEKLFYPDSGLTKGDLGLYLQAATERMLPHLANRPLSVLRCPDGQAGQCFFQRHAGRSLPKAFRHVTISDKDGKKVENIYIADAEGTHAAAQFDVLEFHIWGVHVDGVERPDRLVFALDPDPSVAFPAVREAAEHMRMALDALGLASFAMLSGGKGVHVVVPIVPDHGWPVIGRFCRAPAERFADEAPDLDVAIMSKTKRTGRIFIDHFRNGRTASAIAPYSPRARVGANVAWPVTWEELAKARDAGMISIESAVRRLAGPDPWSDYNRRQLSRRGALGALDVPVD